MLFGVEVDADFVLDEGLDFGGLAVDDVVVVVDDPDRDLQDLLQTQEDFGLHDLEHALEAEHQQEHLVVSEVLVQEGFL